MPKPIVVKVIFNNFPKLPAELQREADIVCAQTAKQIETDMKASYDTPKSGRTYRRGSVKRSGRVVGYKFHRASAPGEAPARDLGALYNATRSGRLRLLLHWAGIMGSPGDKDQGKIAKHLEYGTSKMAARPFLRPAVQRRRGEFFQRMRGVLKKMNGRP